MKRIFLLIALVALIGCTSPPPATPTAPAVDTPPELTFRELPVTFTPVPAPSLMPSVAGTPLRHPTEIPDTPIPFGETAVELRYIIPALGLDRRLQGNIGSQIIFVDEMTGLALQRNNQGNVLLQLQQVLPTTVLEEMPEGCSTCVEVRYQLPLAGEAGSGWLQDPVILASIENLMARTLGAHFPPGTMVGLRRSASPYAPAHTIALAADGRSWSWLATEAQIQEPLLTPDMLATIREQLEALPLNELSREYVVSCPGSPSETLFLNPTGGDTPEAGQMIEVACPEFALPSTLLPLYTTLDALASQKLAGVEGPVRPPAAFPLTALLDYERADGAQLTLFQSGQAVTIAPSGAVFTTSLPVSQVISLTTSLLNSNLLQPGLSTFQGQATAVASGTTTPPTASLFSRILVRGPDALYDARWTGTIDPALLPLDTLLDLLLSESPTPITTGSPEATMATTVEATLTIGETPTPSPPPETPGLTPSSTP